MTSYVSVQASQTDARKAADAIRDYWAGFGATVTVSVEPATRQSGMRLDKPVYRIVSDLVNGWPRDWDSPGAERRAKRIIADTLERVDRSGAPQSEHALILARNRRMVALAEAGFSPATIAERMAVSPNAVRTALHRAGVRRKRMRIRPEGSA